MKRTPIVRRTPLKRVSAKRAKEGRIYAERRKLFLAAHPWCQIWLAENGVEEKDVLRHGIAYVRHPILTHISTPEQAPRSTEIHHRLKRGKNYLNEASWMAVSREMHEKVEQNKSWARQRGYLV